MRRRNGFGTFGGVYVPNLLTILGVIMYLRMGWVVGNAGMKNTLVILLIANLITLFTAFSISSIATNMRVRGGGAYYMISRSLGAEVGGSIGIPLYLAQALVISLYIVGFTESLSLLFPQLNQIVVNISTLCVLIIISLISAGLVIRIQYVILAVIVLSLLSFFLGRPLSFDQVQMASRYTEGYDFWSVFAVFFPAVTGILSGVSLSGDLKDPARSIPAGTILSVLTGAVVYLLVAVWFSLASSREELTENNLIMITMARWGPLVYAGIWGATLSSALANILAAPRTLQALAKDGIVFRFLGKGTGQGKEPLVATLFTFVLVFGVLLVGDLNTIAPVLTIFFLITYGSMNVIAFLEGLVKRPGFRPTFRIHWLISLAGAAGCVWVMFLVNPLACIVGFTFVLIIYLILKRIQIQKKWGDFRRGIWSALIRFSLSNLEHSKDHSGSWRPALLLISRDLISRQELVQVAFGLTQKSGFLSCINLLKSDNYDTGQLEKDAMQFRKKLQENRIQAFYRNVIVDHYLSGQLMASQLHGVGEFKHNTILLDWSEATGGRLAPGSSEAVDQFRLIRFYSQQNNSLLLLHVNSAIPRSGYRVIDIWWDPGQKNGSFMLLLAHLLASGRHWGDISLNIKTVVLKDKREQTLEVLHALVQRSRIKASVQVLHPASDQEIHLGIQFERVQRKRQLQKKWMSSLRALLPYVRRDTKDVLELKPEAAQTGGEVHADDQLDDQLKEKLSDQIQERDNFIINKNINNIIVENSTGADLVMLGFNIPAKGKEKKYIGKMESLLKKIPDTLLVNCPVDFDLLD
jgi:amino acid transporter